jgi:hypothetical protein
MAKNFDGREDAVKRGTLVYQSYRAQRPGVVVDIDDEGQAIVLWSTPKRGNSITHEKIKSLKDFDALANDNMKKARNQQKHIEELTDRLQ